MVRNALPLILLIALLSCDDGPGPPPRPQPSAVQSTTAAATVSALPALPPPPKRSWLEQRLLDSDPRFTQWLADAEEVKLQILVNVIEPDGSPGASHQLRADAEYFYPASAIKLFLGVEALRHTTGLLEEEIPLNTRIMRCRIGKSGCKPPREDAEEDEEGKPEIPLDKKKHQKLRLGKEIRKMLSYSDNDSFNRLYDIIGHRALNEAMAELGFGSVRFHHKMNAPPKRSRRTPRVLLMPPGKRAIRIKKRDSDMQLAATAAGGLRVGEGYRDHTGLVKEPMSFAGKNAVSLADLQRMLLSILFPEHPRAVPLGLSKAHREHLISAMTARLRHRKNAAEHGPLTPGVLDALPLKRARYVSKSGRAYGFHLENAFVQDTESGRGYFATVVVYANPNGILNDDDYAYKKLSRPLLAAVGKALTEALLADQGKGAADGDEGSGGKNSSGADSSAAASAKAAD